MSLNIQITTVTHNQQRYPTVGDWFDKDGVLHIVVSDMRDWRKEAVVAVHELCEVLLCRDHGVTESEVDVFDINYEASRLQGDVSEPGDNPKSPYAEEHCFATGIERLLVAAFGMSWRDYEETVEAL